MNVLSSSLYPVLPYISICFIISHFLFSGRYNRKPGGILIYFSARGRATEQSVIFRIPTPGQGTIFVKIGSVTWSPLVIFYSGRSFQAICTLRM